MCSKIGGETNLKNQKFGIEIEFTGITRQQAIEVLSEYFGRSYSHDYGSYDEYSVLDDQGRKWKLVSDASIVCQRKENGQTIGATREYAVELVSPICKYEDIETIQEIVRKLRESGGFCNKSTGIHIHCDGANHTPQSIRNFINIIASKNDLLYKSLGIPYERMQYCKALDENLVSDMNRLKPKTMEQIADIWYARSSESRTRHYNETRYHFLNLHSLFNGNGTCEIRGYNATLHAGKIKAYVQLSLAISHQALIQKRANPRITVSTNEKYTFRTYLLRLGLIGNEFKTARQHLLDKLEGNIAWKNPEDALKQREAIKAQRQAERDEQQQSSQSIISEVAQEQEHSEIELQEEPEQDQGMTFSV